MSRHIFFLFNFSLSCITAFSQADKPKIEKGFALVELFTSEGCSSCPAADEAVMDIAKQYKKGVYILGFHVDYWNYLGWKDIFSKAEYSERQKKYGAAFSLNTIYTPQIVVNGKKEFVGSDKNKLQQTIADELKNNNEEKVALSVKEMPDKKIAVSFSSSNNKNNLVNIALVQLYGQNNVGKGENEGRLLHHINIVRDLKIMDETNKENTVYFSIPKGLTKKEIGIIAFIQDKNNLHVIGAASAGIQ